MNKTNEMGTKSIPKLLLKFSIPAIIGLLVNALYNIVDSIFVGRGVGDLALAGVTVTLPIITIFMAFIMLIGTVTNIVLDYIFIFPLDMGMQGAALATILAYFLTSSWVLYHFISGRSRIRIKKENFKLEWRIVQAIAIIGFPSFVLQLGGSIQQTIFNRSLAEYGGDLSLAVIGIIMSITTFLIMPAMGINQGAQPIIGYNYGAKRYDRVKDTLKLSLLAATGIVSLGFLISKLWPAQLIGLFNKNPELIELGMHAMAISFMFIPLIGIQMISSGYFQAVGKPKQATILGLSRQVFIFIPVLLILPRKYGLEGVWWSAPFSDIGAFILTSVWLLFEIKSLEKAHKKHTKDQEGKEQDLLSQALDI